MNQVDYIFALCLTFAASLILTPIFVWLAKRLKVMDLPGAERKIHSRPVPLWGGLAVIVSFNLVIVLYAWFTDDLTAGTVMLKNIFGLCLGTVFLGIGGALDDKYNLKPRWQIIWPLLAIFCVIASGIGIDWVTNPFGEGIIYLNQFQFKLFWLDGFPYKLTLLADMFTVVWLLAMIYTTKLLDGLDGLVSGLAIVAAVFIFLTGLNKSEIMQNDIALIAMIMAGAFAGFLVYNFNPAGVFLGESGSTVAGFLLGSLSIMSGSKVGVTLMLLSIPVLDFVWTIIRRLMEKKSPFATSDKKHLHHRLLDSGFTVKQAVFFLYFIALIFGAMAYYVQDFGLSYLTVAAGALVVFMLILAFVYKRQKERSAGLTE